MASKTIRIGWAVVAILPWLSVVLLTLSYGVDVPLVDQWAMPPLLEKSCAGTLTLQDLFAQYAEHRLLFPRLITIGLARLSGWNIRWELATNLALATLTGLVLLLLVRRASTVSGARMPPWAPALFSILTFSLCQWENWLWGGQIHFFLNALCVCAGIFALWNGRRIGGFVFAILLGVVATFSLASGLFFWWIGLPVIAMAEVPAGVRWRRIAAWLAAGIAVYAIYFHHFVPFSPPGERLNPVVSPVIFGRYLLTFLGSPAVSFSGSSYPPRDSGLAALVGLASVVLFALLVFRACRNGTARRRGTTPFAGLGGYALLAGVAAAIGRGKFGIPQAMAPRYTTISLLWWIGLCGALLIQVASPETGTVEEGAHLPRWRAVARGMILLVAVLVLLSSVVCVPVFPRRWRLLEPTRGAVLEAKPESMLARLHPNVNLVTSGIAILKARRLSVFRDMPDRLGIRPLAAPLETFGQKLTAEDRAPALRVGQHAGLRIRVANPTNENWSALGDGTGAYSVRLSYHWLRQDGTIAIWDGKRTLLPRDLGPGQTISLQGRLVAPSTPGRFTLAWTLVQEDVNWFDRAGAGVLEMKVEVAP